MGSGTHPLLQSHMPTCTHIQCSRDLECVYQPIWHGPSGNTWTPVKANVLTRTHTHTHTHSKYSHDTYHNFSYLLITDLFCNIYDLSYQEIVKEKGNIAYLKNTLYSVFADLHKLLEIVTSSRDIMSVHWIHPKAAGSPIKTSYWLLLSRSQHTQLRQIISTENKGSEHTLSATEVLQEKAV